MGDQAQHSAWREQLDSFIENPLAYLFAVVLLVWAGLVTACWALAYPLTRRRRRALLLELRLANESLVAPNFWGLPPMLLGGITAISAGVLTPTMIKIAPWWVLKHAQRAPRQRDGELEL